MKLYLLSLYQPDGPSPEPEVMERIAADLDAALAWGRRLTLATTLPVEVRPFQGEAED